MADKKISLAGTEPLMLFGFNDVWLRKIEISFPKVLIVARDNSVTLSGSITKINQIEKVLGEMIRVLNRNNNLTENDVDTILDISGTEGPIDNAELGDVILFTHKGNKIKAKTPGQTKLLKSARKNDVVFAVGPAGTGKTYMAVALAVAALKSRQVKRIILSRPAVEAGERLGFLPGDLQDKVDPYLRPLYDALGDMIPPHKLRAYMDENVIEIVPLAYMRGRTLHAAFVILDEAQNATNAQMRMFLTRLGPNSRTIITGDVTQIDLPSRNNSGLVQAKKVLQGIEGINFVKFDENDVVRHRLVKEIIKAYTKNDENG